MWLLRTCDMRPVTFDVPKNRIFPIQNVGGGELPKKYGEDAKNFLRQRKQVNRVMAAELPAR